MSTPLLALKSELVDNVDAYTGPQIGRVHNTLDTLARMAFVPFGAGILKRPGTGSLLVSAGTGLSVTIAPGAAILPVGSSNFCPVRFGATATINGLPANRGSGNPIYLHLLFDSGTLVTDSQGDVVTRGDSYEDGLPDIRVSDLESIAGAILLAKITTNGAAILTVEDRRSPSFITMPVAWTDITGKPTTFAPSAHTHSPSDITGFDTQVRTNRLDQMAAAMADVSMGGWKLTNLAAPVLSTDAARKGDVDAARNGLIIKEPVRAATTTNIALSGTQTVDDVPLVADDRVLVKNQTTGSTNGIYVVATGAWSRASDADTSAEVKGGMACWVNEGTANGDRQFALTTNNPIVLGTTSLNFAQSGVSGGVSSVNGQTGTATLDSTNINGQDPTNSSATASLQTIFANLWAAINGKVSFVIHGLTAKTTRTGADEIPIYSADDNAQRKITVNDFLKGFQISTVSSSSVTIGTGSKSFIVEPGITFLLGTPRVRLRAQTDSPFMEGAVASYEISTGALLVTVDRIGGSGTFASWFVGVAGEPGSSTATQIQSVSVSTTAPTTGQVLTATSATAAAWQTPTGGDMLATLINTEVAIAGASTLLSTSFGKQHVCSGTSANYTVTLPAVSGNAGKLLAVRMTNGLTKLVTVKGNASELIDGSNTRVMWAQENAILLCDGTGWTKISGKSRPMISVMRLAPGSPGIAQNVSNATMTKVLLNAADIDNTGAMANTTNNRIDIRRPGLYQTSGLLCLICNNPVPRFICNLFKTGSQDIAAETAIYVGSGNVPTCFVQGERSLVAGDYMELDCYQSSGFSQSLYGDPTATACLLRVVEIPSW